MRPSVRGVVLVMLPVPRVPSVSDTSKQNRSSHKSERFVELTGFVELVGFIMLIVNFEF
jgi:hypothetical protein